MKLDRTKVRKDFEIPVSIYEEIVDTLEEGLKDIETELDTQTVYLVINNIIRSKYEYKKNYLQMPPDELLRLTKKVIEGSGNDLLLPTWTITPEERKEIENREPKDISDVEYYSKYY